MPLTVNIAGRWTATSKITGEGSPSNLGITETGFRIGWKLLGRMHERTTRYGDCPLDFYVTGIRMSLSCIFHEFSATELRLLTKAVSRTAIVPKAANTWTVPRSGTGLTGSAAEIVLSAVATTPARNNGFATTTFHAVSPDPDFLTEIDLGPEKLMLPFRGIVWPTNSGVTNPPKLLTTTWANP